MQSKLTNRRKLTVTGHSHKQEQSTEQERQAGGERIYKWEMATGEERLPPAWQASEKKRAVNRAGGGQGRAQVLLRAAPEVTKRRQGFASKGQGSSAFRP